MKNNYEKTIIIILNILVPMLFGGMAYIFFRPDAYISQWVYSVFVDVKYNADYINMMRKSMLGNMFINYFSDICWAYALSFAIYHSLRAKSVIPSCLICILFCSTIELLQINGIVSGTFDIMDIIAESIVCLVSHFIICIIGGKRNEKS